MKELFPNLAPAKWLKINFNEEAKKTTLNLTDAKICRSFIDDFHKENNIKYSYGGFLEDRSHVWKNHYNSDSQAFIHLGVDYNIPVGTEVASPIKGNVIHLMQDNDRYGGWGGRMIIKHDSLPLYILFGHMRQTFRKNLNDICNVGDIIGSVGDINENGNWFPHLHVQIIDEIFYQKYAKKPERIDGYLQKDHHLLAHVLNPEILIHNLCNN